MAGERIPCAPDQSSIDVLVHQPQEAFSGTDSSILTSENISSILLCALSSAPSSGTLAVVHESLMIIKIFHQAFRNSP